MVNYLRIFNDFELDLRQRVDALSKLIFLFSGGALTPTASASVNNKSKFLYVLYYLKLSWAFFILSIPSFLFVIDVTLTICKRVKLQCEKIY